MTYDEYKTQTPDEDYVENECGFCGTPCQKAFCSDDCKRADILSL